MLQSIVGSESGMRVLLFLLVNEKGYATQIQKAYSCALSPIQNALNKFERAGVLVAAVQSGKRVYHFNPNYPLSVELKTLLQKGFSYLAPEEKKQLLDHRKMTLSSSKAQKKQIFESLRAFWDRSLQVQQMTIRTQTGKEAIGEVKVIEEKPNVLIFTEKGKWVKGEQKNMTFHNALRWTFVFEEGLVRLEHLRYGPHHPIFLLHLVPIGSQELESINSHICQGDCYFGSIKLENQGIYLNWKVLSDKKNETFYYIYI